MYSQSIKYKGVEESVLQAQQQSSMPICPYKWSRRGSIDSTEDRQENIEKVQLHQSEIGEILDKTLPLLRCFHPCIQNGRQNKIPDKKCNTSLIEDWISKQFIVGRQRRTKRGDC
jgi:hypothetical protein